MRSLALALGLLGGSALAAGGPRFDLLPLGTYGAAYEANLTAFAVRPVGADAYRVLLDAGSLAGAARVGRARTDALSGRSRGAAAIEEFFLGLEDVFLTHSHYDHLAGLVVQSPSLFARARPPLRVHGPPETTSALAEDIFNGRVWGDFVAAGKVSLHGLTPSTPVPAAGLTVEAFPLDHTVPCFGYEVRAPGGAAFLFLGDTGPTRGYLPRARQLLRAGQLRALALECSFGDAKEALAIQTGHLTPRLLGEHLRELVDPAREGDRSPLGPDLPGMARALRGVRILVHHLKPLDEVAVRRQLRPLREAGLELILPRQGQRLLL